MFNFNDIASIAFDEATEKYQNDYVIDPTKQIMVFEALRSLDIDMSEQCDLMSVEVEERYDDLIIDVAMVGRGMYITYEVLEDLLCVDGNITVVPVIRNGVVEVEARVSMLGFWVKKEVA